MKSPIDLLAVILAMAVATAATRFLPFLLPPRWLEHPVIGALKQGLPAVILLLLVVYSLKDTSVLTSPWGLPEAAALISVVGLHFWKRNALLSISAGTCLYMLLVQSAP